jgi:hypothetical protein
VISTPQHTERTANLQSIIRLLKKGPRTDKEIEMRCFLGERARGNCMKILEGVGIVERSRTDNKVWQLSRAYLQGNFPLRMGPGGGKGGGKGGRNRG